MSNRDYLGFDETFYTAGCSTDQEPFCFIENGRFHNMSEATYRNPAGSWRSGMAAPDWDNKSVDVQFTQWALKFIERTHKSRPEQPFFLYLPLSSPHSPHITADFAIGKSKAGVRGDMVWLVDWSVGKIMAKLDALGVADDTLLIVTSDNGPLPGSLKPGAPEGTAKVTNKHLSAGRLRGYKARVWEGGHRVPFIARWPDRIPIGHVSDHTICLTDLLATIAAIVGENLPEENGEDSFNQLPALLGNSMQPRPAIVHHSSSAFTLRHGKWKIVFGVGENRVKTVDGRGCLYDLDSDPFETNDLWSQHPDVFADLTRQFETIRKNGRSR